MPVETLRPADGRLAPLPFASAMPFRILNKGPDYFRRRTEPAARKLSAVERLEADKAKYVKSQQVALTRQAPIKPPIIRKPLIPPGVTFQGHVDVPPARKVPRCPADENGGTRDVAERRPALNLDVLNNLINDVCVPPPRPQSSSSSTSPSSSSPSSGVKSVSSGPSERDESTRLLNSLKPPPTNLRPPLAEPGRRPPPVPARVHRFGAPVPYVSPTSVTVRRVDVRPQEELRPQRTLLQPPLRPRQIPQGQVPVPLPPQPHPTPQAPPPPPAYLPPSPMLVRAGIIPPPSPAFTRISNASSKGSTRKHPSLHRSKSDLSDRLSRATADLERFFNYCGLDPDEVDAMGGVERFTRASSDIVSVSKLRSVSTPSSDGRDEGERGREDGGEGEDEDDDDEDSPSRTGERVPYGISVIERNARVIKWLYGIRQARDTVGNVISNV